MPPAIAAAEPPLEPPAHAEKYSSILVTNQHLSPLLGGMKKRTRPKSSETTPPTAKRAVKDVESTAVSAKSTPAENFTRLIELHNTKGPVPFRPRHEGQVVT
jgi:hypothetical protein